jgi:hypothetical protein
VSVSWATSRAPSSLIASSSSSIAGEDDDTRRQHLERRCTGRHQAGDALRFTAQDHLGDRFVLQVIQNQITQPFQHHIVRIVRLPSLVLVLLLSLVLI